MSALENTRSQISAFDTCPIRFRSELKRLQKAQEKAAKKAEKEAKAPAKQAAAPGAGKKKQNDDDLDPAVSGSFRMNTPN